MCLSLCTIGLSYLLLPFKPAIPSTTRWSQLHVAEERTLDLPDSSCIVLRCAHGEDTKRGMLGCGVQMSTAIDSECRHH